MHALDLGKLGMHATRCASHSLGSDPCFCAYRAQEPPAEPTPEQIARVEHSRYALGHLWRSRMLRSSMHTDAPRRHTALGLTAYCQVTSPIRRCARACIVASGVLQQAGWALAYQCG